MLYIYRVTFTINIPQMLAYIPYMDPMGNLSCGWETQFVAPTGSHGNSDRQNSVSWYIPLKNHHRF